MVKSEEIVSGLKAKIIGLQQDIDEALRKVPTGELDELVRQLTPLTRGPIRLRVNPEIIRERFRSYDVVGGNKNYALTILKVYLQESDELDYSRENHIKHEMIEFVLKKYDARLRVNFFDDKLQIIPMWTRRVGTPAAITRRNTSETIIYTIDIQNLDKELPGVMKDITDLLNGLTGHVGASTGRLYSVREPCPY